MNLRQIALQALKDAGMLFQEDELVDTMDYGTSEGVKKAWLVRCRRMPKDKLRNTRFNFVPVEPAPFNNLKEAIEWSKANVIGIIPPSESGGKGVVQISTSSVREMLNPRQRDKSFSQEVHFSALTKIKEIIRESHIVESHPDFNKDKTGHRSRLAGINRDISINVAYGALSINSLPYRVRTTFKKYRLTQKSKAYAYSVDKIKILPGTLGGKANLTTYPTDKISISGGILLNDVCDVNGVPLV